MHQEKRYNLKKASGLENSSAEGRNDAYGAGNNASFHLRPYMGEILRKPQSETATESQSGGGGADIKGIRIKDLREIIT